MRAKLVVCFTAIILTHLPLAASDEASLKAAHTLLMEAIRSADVTAIEESVHRRALGFFRASIFPVMLTTRYTAKDVAPYLIGDFVRFTRTTTQSEYLVVENTGIVLNTFQLRGQGGTGSARSTALYVYSDRRWRLVSWHSSEFQATGK